MVLGRHPPAVSHPRPPHRVLPPCSKITFVSTIGLICFFFSMAVLIENAIVIMLFYYKEAHL